MKKRIRSIMGTSLFRNISSMGIIRVSQYLIPLITIPYLARVLGVEGMGKAAFAQAVATYFAFAPEMGISLHAPREIAVNAGDRKKVEIIVNNLFFARTIVSVIVSGLFVVCVFLVDKFYSEKTVFLFSAIAIVNYNMTLAWFFQGIEKMWNTAVANIIGAVLGMIGIFAFIHRPDHYMYVPLVYGVSGMLPVAYTVYAVRREGYDFVNLSLLDFREIRRIIVEAFPLYVSNVSIQVYTGIYTVVLGFMTNEIVVGFYYAAEKLVKAGLSIMGILGQAFYPHMSRTYRAGKKKMLRELKIAAMVILGFSVSATVFTFVMAELIVKIIYGADYAQSVLPLRILSFLFVIVGMSNVIGVQILLPMGKRKTVSLSVVFAAVLSITALFILAPIWKENGTAVAYVIAELAVAVFQMSYIWIYYRRDVYRLLREIRDSYNYDYF